MRIFFVLVVIFCFSLSGCAVFDISPLKERVSNLEKKVDSLEKDQLTNSEAPAIVPVPSTAAKETIIIPKRSSRVSLSKRDIQTALKKTGYYNGPVDGKIGPRTKKAIREFQADNGLKVDGIVGPRTRMELEKHLSSIK